MKTATRKFCARIDEAFQLLKDHAKEEARTLFFQLVAESSDNIEEILQLGNLARHLGEKVAAINLYAEAVIQYPENAGYLNDLAQAYLDNDMLEKAEELLQKAIDTNPDFYLSYIKLSYIAIRNQSFSTAVEILEKARALKPSEPDIYFNLISALNHVGRTEDACRYAKKLIKLQPGKAENYHLMGRVLTGLGQFEEAETSFKKAISMDRTLGYSYIDIASIKKYTEKDSAFIKQAEKALKMSMPATYRSAIHFSLGKMYSDCGKWDEAFQHYQRGNLIAKPAVYERAPYDVYNKTHKVFTGKFLEEHRTAGNDTETPVFVVGMPRSGTTLIERIIASHPQGAGAGELKAIAHVNYEICPNDKLDRYRSALTASVKDGGIEKGIDYYLKILRDQREDASRVVDKMPNNFIFLGLIHLMFPRAKIINVIRSPLDVCLSCYFQAFESIDWANDFESLVEQYGLYRKAIDYWRKVLPDNTIIDIEYEKLTADPEVEARKLIEGIGLQWDDSCLEFYKKKSAVITASVWQVRQPVYSSSRKRWMNYAKHIEELANGLQAYLNNDEIEELKRQGVKLKKKWRLNPFA